MSASDVIRWALALEEEARADRVRADSLERQLAQREAQVGFTAECAVDGTRYRDECGACSIARRVARWESS